MSFDKKTEHVRNKIQYIISNEQHKALSEKELSNLSVAIISNCTIFDIDVDIILSIISAESCYRQYAKSSVGAIGYLQVYHKVWSDTIKDADSLYDTYENVYWGCYIFKYFMKRYDENLYYAIAGYNGGRIVDGGIRPASTLRYVNKVSNMICRLEKLSI
jgi:soluble lytic murein transglycosylase-like protein